MNLERSSMNNKRIQIIGILCLLAIALLMCACQLSVGELKKGLYISGANKLNLSDDQGYHLSYGSDVTSSFINAGTYTIDGSAIKAGNVVFEMDKEGHLVVKESSDDKIAVGSVFEYAPAYMQSKE